MQLFKVYARIDDVSPVGCPGGIATPRPCALIKQDKRAGLKGLVYAPEPMPHMDRTSSERVKLHSGHDTVVGSGKNYAEHLPRDLKVANAIYQAIFVCRRASIILFCIPFDGRPEDQNAES